MQNHSLIHAATIFLWGMPGAGKSTFGEAYASHIGASFADLDAYITMTTGRSPAHWIRTDGEVEFRKVEAAALRTLWSAQRPGVLACGGGTPCFGGNAAWMKRRGWTVWLEVPLPLLLKRLARPSATDRPLLEGEAGLSGRLRSLLEAREPCYRRAHFTLQASAPDAMKAQLEALLSANTL